MRSGDRIAARRQVAAHRRPLQRGIAGPVDVGRTFPQGKRRESRAGDFAPSDVEGDRNRRGRRTQIVEEILHGGFEPRHEGRWRAADAAVPVDDEGDPIERGPILLRRRAPAGTATGATGAAFRKEVDRGPARLREIATETNRQPNWWHRRNRTR